MQDDQLDTCDHVFYPSMWRRGEEAVPDEPIDCSIESVENYDNCKYHIGSDKANKDPADLFVDLLNEDEKVFGVKFKNIILDEDNLQNITVNSAVLRNAQINQLKIKNGDVGFELTLMGCRINKYSEYHTRVLSPRQYVNCRFYEKFHFRPSEINSKIDIEHSKISNNIEVTGNFNSPININNCDVDDSLHIHSSQFTDCFNLHESYIRGNIEISSSEFLSDLSIHDCELPLYIKVLSTKINNLICTSSQGLPTLFDFDGNSSIENGSITPGESNSIYYDFSHCTLGKVSLEDTDPELKNFLFKDTKYDGFDFYQIYDELNNIGHEIHKFGYSYDEFNYHYIYSDMNPVIENSFDTQTAFKNQVETYTRAKNCAKSSGINDSASSFFVNQKKSEKALDQARRTESNISHKKRYKLWKGIQKNRFLKWSCLYGENPMYPLYWSGATILGYSLTYPYVGISSDGNTVIRNNLCILDCQITKNSIDIWFDSVYISIATFSSVGTNTYYFETLLSRIIIGSEAVLGALLIALFVFTLGRQMGR